MVGVLIVNDKNLDVKHYLFFSRDSPDDGAFLGDRLLLGFAFYGVEIITADKGRTQCQN